MLIVFTGVYFGFIGLNTIRVDVVFVIVLNHMIKVLFKTPEAGYLQEKYPLNYNNKASQCIIR